MGLVFFIDSIVYGLILLVTYYIFNKTFARSNVAYIFLASFVVKVVSLFFELKALSSIVDVALISAVLSVVVSNEQKINKLLKRNKAPKNII